MNKKTRELIYNIIIFTVGNVLVKLISLFLMPLYTSHMTTDQYGIAELLNNLIEIVLPIATLCIIDAVYRYSIDDNTDLSQLFTNATKTLLKGYILIIVGSAAIYFFSGYEYLPCFVALYIATTINKLCSQFARGLGHVKRFVVGGIINALILVIMNVILLVRFDGGVEAYIISLTVSQLVAGIFNFITSKEYKYLDFGMNGSGLQKELLRFSIPNIPNALSWWVNNVSSRYIILFFIGNSAAGMYTAASKLPAIINVLATIFQQAWQYSTSKEINEKESGVFFTEVFKYYIAFITLSSSVIIVLIPFLSRFILKGDFYMAWRYVPMLLVSATIGCISTFFGTFYTAIKNNRMAMITTIIGATVNIAFNLMLVQQIGILSAMIAGVLSFSVITVLRIIDTNKFSDIKYNWLSICIQYILLIIQSVIWLCNLQYALYLEIGIFIVIMCINYKNIISTYMCFIKILKKYKIQKI